MPQKRSAALQKWFSGILVAQIDNKYVYSRPNPICLCLGHALYSTKLKSQMAVR